jgi:hypothetical protein
MLEPVVGGELSVELVNALLLALWVTLPGLALCYTQQSLAARRMRPEFSLRKSEATELDRAVRLYDKVRRRLNEISDRGERSRGFWRALFDCQADLSQSQADEFADLEAHAQHLRAMIVRLRRRPLYRLQSWVHVLSSRFALGRALAAHVAGLTLLVLAFHVVGEPALADEAPASAGKMLVWYPIDERFFYANAIATGFAAVAAPLFYLLRRVSLHYEYEVEFCTFRDLADCDPDCTLDQTEADESLPQQEDGTEAGADTSWFAVLGLPSSATLEEVKDAYKELIKQNHPDRVHGMSAALKQLAEAETKKLNAAYQQALKVLPALAAEPEMAAS